MNLNQKETIKKGIEYLKTHDWCQINLYNGPITDNPDICAFCALGAIAMANGFNPKDISTTDNSLEYYMYEFIKKDLTLEAEGIYKIIYSINDTVDTDKDNVIRHLEMLVKD